MFGRRGCPLAGFTRRPLASGWCSSDLNRCQCGNFGDPVKACSCSETSVTRYQRRISGPLLDRIDLFVEVPRIDYEKLSSLAPAESSSQVRARVDRARSKQTQRFEGRAAQANTDMAPADVRELVQGRLDDQAKAFLKLATTQLSLSARAFHRVLKVARTIADLACSEEVTTAHVAEAVQYRQRSRAV
ncbi:MAG TPA: ATP-binding protein [Dehalococcoidia bacterium]|nr:ATP-binding protein [Dehalococcoidia bacterium]